MTNTTTPESLPTIARVPPEILLRIFQAYANVSTNPPDELFSETDPPACSSDILGPYSWIYITHVCQHWRAVSLSFPLLWSSIVVTHHIECMRTMLERSQRVPLDVRTAVSTRCSISRPFPIKSLSLILQELHRVRSLNLSINWWMYDDVKELLQGRAPLLRALNLSTPNGACDGGWTYPSVSVNQETDLAQIEDISVRGYEFPWLDPLPFRSLKRLHVNGHGLPKLAIEDVARALALMPRLVSLTLQGVFHSGHAQTLSRAKPEVLTMPILEQLTLCGDSLACSTLLRLMKIPAAARITLDYSSEECKESLAASMSFVSHELVATTSVPSFTSITHMGASRHIRFETTLLDDSAPSTPFFPNPNRLKLSMAIAPLASHLETVCDVLRADETQVLQITPLYGQFTECWNVFEKFGNVEEAHLTKWNCPDVTAFLQHGLGGTHGDNKDHPWRSRRSSSGHEGAQAALFPSLRVLVVSWAAFFGTESARLLRDALVARSDRGLVLERLVFKDCCGLDAMDIAALRGIVEVVLDTD